MTNRLAGEQSPYLLQHANNPVDWYPWGAEALARARIENKPILLSIGYAACHWCHVMERESFENAETAALMNERFVNIKVDREERPDLDGIYMQAVQAITGHGGWPMTVFLTPECLPYYGGTYFPPEDRAGMPSFRRILTVASDAFHAKPADVARTAASVREMYAHSAQATRGAGPLSATLLDRAYQTLAASYDETSGGFDGAPKFPQAMSLDFLLRYSARERGRKHALEMALRSFRKMASGGFYDQVGGGFARYTVDAAWLVPHFEKMLYDNALLVRLGVHLWQATRDDDVRRVVVETIEWTAREMRAPGGGFHSSLDADSEGHEGAFYVWNAREFDEILGGDAPVARAYWGVTDDGNFEGMNVLSVVPGRATIAEQFNISEAHLMNVIERSRRKLFDARSRRVRPGRDDKVLASWNGLMVRGIAEAARAFGDERYRALAVGGAAFLFDHMVRDGRVLRCYTNGAARIAGYLEDHAALGLAALAVHDLTFDDLWLDRARDMGATIVRWFWDDATSAFYDTASDHEILITRPRDVTDGATPSGTSLAVELLLRLAEIFGDTDARRRATYVAETLAPSVQRHPMAFGHLLGSIDMLINGAVELAIVGEPGGADFWTLANAAAELYVPALVLAGGAPRSDGNALLAGRGLRDGKATAYVCRGHACDEPVTTAGELREQLRKTDLSSRFSGRV